MATERIHEMPTTNGYYQIRGIVNGVEKQSFYTEKKTKTNKNFRMINFGVEYDKHKSVYMTLSGMPRDKVYFSKKDKNGKNVTDNVSWVNRNKIPDGARMFNSINCGLTKIAGTEDNDQRILIDYDACDYIANNLKDGSSVYVGGNLEFSSYTKDGVVNRSTKLIPNQISLCNTVDFDSEQYVSKNYFTQTIVFMGIEKEKEDDKPTGRFVVEAKIVNYNSIEPVEFIIEDVDLANKFRNHLKPYNAITVNGDITVVHSVEEVKNDDGWGRVDPTKKIDRSSKREFVIKGTNGAPDKETYTEKAINDAIRKMNAAKTAEENFNGKVESSSVDDWEKLGSVDDIDTDW
jgi:hypothetical protein